jgi:competence protein ComEC
MGIVVALAALLGGIVLGERMGPSPASAPLLLGAVLLVSALAWSGRTRLFVAAVALVLLGIATMGRALHGAAHHGVSPGPLDATGTLATDAEGERFTVGALVRLDAPQRTLVVRARGNDANRLRVLAAGDRVRLQGDVLPLGRSRFDEYFRWRHAVAVVDGAHVAAATAPSNSVYAAANRFRALAARGTRTLDTERRALLAGFLFGDTRAIPDDVADDYRDAGLSHLLAVSGANVAFMLALIGPLLRRLPLGARSALALLTIVTFAAVTRFEPSVLRASALAAVSVLSALSGRPVARLRALILACIALLLADPFLIHSLGFVLSAGASAGIVLFAGPIATRLRGPAPVRDALAVSLAAQVGVTPILLIAFDSVPLVTPLTNVLAAPAAAALGAFGLPVALASGIVPALGPVLHPVNAVLLWWVTAVAHAGAGVDIDLDRQALAMVVFVGGLATLAARAVRVAQTR